MGLALVDFSYIFLFNRINSALITDTTAHRTTQLCIFWTLQHLKSRGEITALDNLSVYWKDSLHDAQLLAVLNAWNRMCNLILNLLCGVTVRLNEV